MERVEESRLRLPELIAALTLGIDLGLGQPTEHVLRSCLIALRLGESIEAPPAEREAAYYIALLSSVGCTADASELAAWFGDDNAFRRDTYGVDLAGLPMFGFMLRRAGAGGSPWHRVRIAAALLAEGNEGGAESMAAHCDVAATLAERLGLGPSLYEPMRQLFARWDGKGEPRARRRGRSPCPFDSSSSRTSSRRTEARSARRQRWPWPESARARSSTPRSSPSSSAADDVFAGLDGETTWDEVVAAEPTPSGRSPRSELDEALRVVADFADLKSPYFRGHSRGVAALAADAAAQLGLSESDTGVGASSCAAPRPRPHGRAELDLGQAGRAHGERAGARPPASVLHRARPRAAGGSRPTRRDRRRPPRAPRRLRLPPRAHRRVGFRAGTGARRRRRIPRDDGAAAHRPPLDRPRRRRTSFGARFAPGASTARSPRRCSRRRATGRAPAVAARPAG